MKIICDQMLGTLATWLRILGFDTLYIHHGLNDAAVLVLAQQEQRILITRDTILARKAHKQKIPVVLLQTTHLDEQLSTILTTFCCDQQNILTRCILCNTLLRQIEKPDVYGKVPDAVVKQHQYFMMCPTCSRIYWKGTHYHNMIKKIEMMMNNR